MLSWQRALSSSMKRQSLSGVAVLRWEEASARKAPRDAGKSPRNSAGRLSREKGEGRRHKRSTFAPQSMQVVSSQLLSGSRRLLSWQRRASQRMASTGRGCFIVFEASHRPSLCLYDTQRY